MPVPGGSVAIGLGQSAAEKIAPALLKKIWEGRKWFQLWAWRRNGRARISAAAFLRIRRDQDSCYAVIQNRHRPEQYSAIGGCYKFHPEAVDALTPFDFLPEYKIVDDDIVNDMRGYSRRKHVKAIFDWFRGESAARESGYDCLRRELREELCAESGLISANFPFDELRYIFVRRYFDYSGAEIDGSAITQVKLFEVFDLVPSDLTRSLVASLERSQSEALIWVNANDILAGRCSSKNKAIGAVCELFVRGKILNPTFTPPNRLIMSAIDKTGFK